MKCLLILSWLISHGYPQPQAEAITANFYIESKCDSESRNKYQIGLGQWQGQRRRNLEQLPHPHTLNTQMNFLDSELKTIYLREFLKFNLLKSKSQATIYFCIFYERPRNSIIQCPKRAQILNTRPWEK